MGEKEEKEEIRREKKSKKKENVEAVEMAVNDNNGMKSKKYDKKKKKMEKKNKGNDGVENSVVGEVLVSKNDGVGEKQEKKRKVKSKEVVNNEEKNGKKEDGSEVEKYEKGCDSKEIQKDKKRKKEKRNKSKDDKEEEKNYVTEFGSNKEEDIYVEEGYTLVEEKEKKKKKKRNKVEKDEDSNDGVHGKKSHFGGENDKQSLGLSKDERESDHDVELEVKKDKKRKKEKKYKSTDGRMTSSVEEILNDKEEENNLVTESNKEGYTSLEEKKEKEKKKTKKKKKKGGDQELLMTNNSNNLSAKESNKKEYRSVDMEVEEGNTLGVEKMEKKKKKKKNFPSEIPENSLDIEKKPLRDNDPNSNEGPSASVGNRKRSREKQAPPGKNSDKGETRRKNKTGSADGAENMETRKPSKRVKFSGKVEVFPLPDVTDVGKENKEKGLVRGKRFSLEEDVMVKDAVFKFIKEHDLGDDGIEKVLRCKKYPEARNCWAEINAFMPWRTRDSIYNRAHLLFERAEKRKWTPEELEAIKTFHGKYGPDWRTLADELGKYRIHVKDAWRRTCLPNEKKGRWSQDEYQKLFDLVNMDLRMKISEEKKTKHGMLRDNIAWEAISSKLGTRSNAGCCAKWYEQLESRLVREDKWVSSDDIRLLDALLTKDFSSLEEVDWDNLLDHRPGDICRKRWRQMVNHLGEHRNKAFADQVEILSKRYRADVLEARAAYEERTPVD